MNDVKIELLHMLNSALELEYAARIQYLSHAQQIKGERAELVIGRLEEIASDEEKHEESFRKLIGGYFGGTPSMKIAETHKAGDTKEVLEINLIDEKNAIDFYKKIYRKAIENKADLQYEFETIEHEIRHVILDEEEHVVELSLLQGI
jgi:bacterioferritin (cytochrome b1)